MMSLDIREKFTALQVELGNVYQLIDATSEPLTTTRLLWSESRRLETELSRYEHIDWSLYDELLALLKVRYTALLGEVVEGITDEGKAAALMTIVNGRPSNYVWLKLEITPDTLRYWQR